MLPQTFTQKAIARAAGLDYAAVGQIVTVRPDRILSHDNSAAIIRIFRSLGQERVHDPQRLVIVLDHASPAPTPVHARNHAQIRAFVREQDIPHFFDVGRGVCHQVVSEEALILPGQMLLGADSHTPHAGWMGAFAAGLGRSEVAKLWATGEIWLRVPETIRIELRGRLRPGVSAKDLGLWILRALGPGGAAYRALEFAGPGVAGLTAAQRMTLANLMAEAGAKNAYLPPDARVFAWLARRSVSSNQYSVFSEQVREMALYPDEGASYAGVLTVNLDEIAPAIARPHSPANVVDLAQVVGEPIDEAFIGTCTNGRLEDLAAAAAVLRNADGVVKRVAAGVRLIITPASSQVLQQALELGYIQTFVEAGAIVGAPGCGPCMGNHFGVPAAGERVISTANRNFRGRMGEPESEVYLASPAVVAASAVAGRVAAETFEVSQTSKVWSRGAYAHNAPANARPLPILTASLAQASSSSPAPKTSEVSQTSEVYTGRVWKYGDHVNTDVIFPGKYTYTLHTPQEFAAHALEDLDPSFAARVQPGDIIVAGENWGTGSSREQAVTALKAAGVRIIIASSFARIYYRNMVNSGMTPIIAPDAVAAIQPAETIQVDVTAGVIHCAAGEFPFPPLSPH